MRCDICEKGLDLLSGWFSCPEPNTGEWQFVCVDCPGEAYDFAVERFFRTPASTVDWMAHLHEKQWFRPRKFFDFIDRLRADGNFYSQA